MNRIARLGLIALAPFAGSAAEAEAAPRTAPVATVEVANPSSFARPDSLVVLSLAELGVTSGPLQVREGERPLPTQLLDDDGDARPDRLAFLADLAAARAHTFAVDRGPAASPLPARTHAEVSVKEGGEWREKKYVGGTFRNVDRLVPPPQNSDHSEFIRYEGPGIESDLVAYRFYLDWRNGFDIFGKKLPGLVLAGVGQDGYDSYHAMSDWGADILKVGQSLGMGGFGYWNGTKAVLVSDVALRSTVIRSDGPIHSSLDLVYEGWKIAVPSVPAPVDLTATLAMQAGSPLVDVSLTTDVPLDNLAIGLVIHPKATVLTGDLDVTGEAWSYFATYGPQTLFDDDLGMVLLFRRKDLGLVTRDAESHVLVMKPRGTKLSYAFGALWSGRPGGVRSREGLEAFLAAEVERRTLAPRIRLRNAASEELAALEPLALATRLAESEMRRRGDSLSWGGWDAMTAQPASWTYTTGLLMQAMDDLSTATGEGRFAAYARRTMDSFLAEDGSIHSYAADEFNIDHINPGKMLQRLQARSPEARYEKAVAALSAQLAKHPRTSEGAFWHKQRYPHQLWLDGVYMGMPFLARAGAIEGDGKKMEEAVHEFEIAREHLRDPATGLYFHAWDEARQQNWADPATGRSRWFWARGLGWYAMALVDVLDQIPPERRELRARLLAIVPELAESLARYQDPTGTWFQILDRPQEPGNYREASASAMFTYFFAKAVGEGYLPASYSPVARRAWSGLVGEFVSQTADGSLELRNVCEVAGLGFGRDGSYRYYMSEPVVENDPKGIGPAILAGVQVARLPR